MGYFNSNNAKEKEEKDKLFKAIQSFYLRQEIQVEDYENPYLFITKIANNENYIDDLFEKHTKHIFTLNTSSKLIYKNREEGIIATIQQKAINDNFNFFKESNTNFDNLFIQPFHIPPYAIQRKSLIDLINTELNYINEKAKDDFAKGLVRQENKNQYIINVINDLLEAYIELFQTAKNVSVKDKKYYDLILEKVNQILRDFIIKYFEILPTKNINEIKKHFSNLISFLSTKNSLKSFTASENAENKLNSLRKELIERELISEIKEDSFKRVFLNKIITNRINWIGEIGQLYYFINQSIKSGYIKKPKYKYMITSQCFKINNNDLYADKLQHHKNPSSSKKEEVDKILAILKRKD